jgi:hypothetical protein
MKTIYGVCALTLGTLLALPVQAKTFTTRSHCTPDVSNEEIMKLPNGGSLRKIIRHCIMTAELPFPFDFQKLTCFQTAEFTAEMKVTLAHGYCDVLSTKGDRAAFTIVYDSVNQGRYQYFSGSGAYPGKGSGTYKLITAFPGGGSVYEGTIEWEMP